MRKKQNWNYAKHTSELWHTFDELLDKGYIDESFMILESNPQMYNDPSIQNFDDGLSDEEALKKFYKYVEELDSRNK
ncbi:hypothetical protein NXH76_20590 [Blautia schinkii]|nr:hypothetical protein [Blautia schinkii]